ncbi:MAG: CHRD domain-containing protein [Cyanobacteria bacterium J06623_4]
MKQFYKQLKLSGCALGLGVAAAIGSADIAHGATFQATLSGDQVVPGTDSTASGNMILELNEDKTQLSYSLSLSGVTLKADQRIALRDVNKIHIHAAGPGENGPHVLNIFGLPAEDDADLSVDYAANTLSGVWDDGDASDLNGNGIADPNDSKPLTNFVTALEAGGLYIQVHTNRFDSATGFPGELRGQIQPTAQSTPEPLGLLGLASIAGWGFYQLKKQGRLN